MSQHSKKRFVFAGFDFFLDAADVLVRSGWDLVGFCAVTQDELVASSHRLKRYGEAHGAIDFGNHLNSDDFNVMRERKIHYLITAGYHARIPASELVGFRAINFHPSLLPHGRGPWPFPYLLDCPHKAGVTVHETIEGLDEGPILIQKPVFVDARDNCHSLEYKCKITGICIARELSGRIDELFLNRVPQPDGGSYWQFPRWETDRKLDFNSSVNEIDKKVRAFGDYQTKAYFDHRNWSVSSVSVWQEKHNYQPGSVVIDDRRYVLVAASDGFVLMLKFSEYTPKE